MSLLKEGLTEDEAGQWFTFNKDPDNGRPVRFFIVPIPDEELRQIARRHMGARHDIKYLKGGVPATSVDNEKSQAAALDKAVRALKKSENFSGRPSEESASTYTKLMGLPVKAGEELLFDSKLTRELKEHVLGQFDALVRWINDKHDSLKIQSAEDEEALKS